MVGSRRFPLYPDIPTLEELGVAGFDDGGFFLLTAPAGLPGPVATALNRALVLSLTAPDIREKLLFAGHDPVQGPNSPDDARAFMVRQLATYGEIVQRTGIRLQP
jgi:tripartite-type tricarboxylate transporter receptor subunit TctC